jgi:hypothetical protein
VLLVELDTQSGKPTKEEGLRVIGNQTRPDGVLAPKSEVERVGIGTRVRMVFTDVAPSLARAPRRPCSAWPISSKPPTLGQIAGRPGVIRCLPHRIAKQR